jgi:hypothetical protein
MTETQIISHKGRKVLAVLPYSRYKRMTEELDDYACLKALRQAKADPSNQKKGRPFIEFARERGYLK